jgi:hypothetical protein
VIAFLQPWVLLGLPLAGVPLLLHLIQRRDPPTVEFPAVRYLVQVTQEHQRRLKLRHWLLLLVRTLLVLLIVLAAAGPSAPLRQAASHAPSALVVVLDNSPSSGAVVAGTPRLAELRAAARRIFDRATPADALWLLTADGLARRGSPAEMAARADSLQPGSRRMDLGEALTTAADVLATDPRPGVIVLITDLQATALSAARVSVPVVIARPDDPPPPNLGVVSLETGAQPWTPEGGAVTISLHGDSGEPSPVSVSLGDRPGRQALVPTGGSGSFQLGGALPGWWTIRASKAPDELRADDDRLALVRIAPVARASWDPRDRFITTAAEVLMASGRLARGGDLSLGFLAGGSSIVMPPADPAELGALNRALERRGAGWRFGVLTTTPALSDSGAVVPRVEVLRRLTLEALRPGATAGVVARVAGSPWIVRSGDLVLLGSRLDPEWTTLPLTASFMPFMDELVNRVARTPLTVLESAPGDAVLLPDAVAAVTRGDRRWQVEGGGAFRPPAPGVYYLLAGRDTVGGVVVNLDARESLLAPATTDAVTGLWPNARVVSLAELPGAAFAGAGRASLAGAFLWVAVLLGLTEVALASGRRRTA